jgi:hypothetical protein
MAKRKDFSIDPEQAPYQLPRKGAWLPTLPDPPAWLLLAAHPRVVLLLLRMLEPYSTAPLLRRGRGRPKGAKNVERDVDLFREALELERRGFSMRAISKDFKRKRRIPDTAGNFCKRLRRWKKYRKPRQK